MFNPQNEPCTCAAMVRQVINAALTYVAAGISVAPIAADGLKRPCWPLLPQVRDARAGRSKPSWKTFQNRRPEPAEIHRWAEQIGIGVFGIAAIAGVVSDNLEILDIDAIDLVEPWATEVFRLAPALLDQLVMVESPRPGLHVYYRCPMIGGSEKLALRNEPDSETGLPKLKTLVETKGEGGYCLVPPSPAACHPTLRQYKFISEHDLTHVPTITPADRDVLLQAARQLNRHTHPMPTVAPRQATRRPTNGRRPGDRFNRSVEWVDILGPHGWTYAGTEGAITYWRRPGKTDGHSATTNFGDMDLLHVFSQNASPLEAGRSYSKFTAYALLGHSGDFAAAAQAVSNRSDVLGSSRNHRRT